LDHNGYPRAAGAALDLFWSYNGLSIAYVYEKHAIQKYTFDHEVAHMFDAKHNRREVRGNTPGTNYGYLMEAPYRTILAYNSDLRHIKRIPFYSSPVTKYTDSNGRQIPTGDKDHNNRGVLIKNRHRIAAIGDQQKSCPTNKKSTRAE